MSVLTASLPNTVPPSDPRQARAERIAEHAHRWFRCHLRADGHKAYAVPSEREDNRYYLVDQRACTCPDFERRGLPCKHILAVRLHCQRARTPRVVLTPAVRAHAATYDALFGGEA